MYFIYSILYIIILLFILPFEYFKRPANLRNIWIKEKLGIYAPEFIKSIGKCIWVHAVSVGEVMAAQPLLKIFSEQYPSKTIIFSTITDTGRKVALENAKENINVVYMPFDLSFLINKIMRKIKPELLIIIETEIWPNFIKSFQKYNIPVVLLNGRISEKSFNGYKKIKFFMKRILENIDLFGMQNEEYSSRIIELGAKKDRVVISGNFKFDVPKPDKIPEWALNIKGRVIVAGSTHDGEEEMITDTFLMLRKEFSDLNLIIAPRHPGRFTSVAEILTEKKLSFLRRSQIIKNQVFQNNIILLDTIGELAKVYGIANIVIIGKSFKSHGGQNPLEPALWGKAIVCGPYMENFPVIQDFLKEKAAIQVTESELYKTLRELLTNPEKAKILGSKARELCEKNSGSVLNAFQILKQFINPNNTDIV